MKRNRQGPLTVPTWKQVAHQIKKIRIVATANHKKEQHEIAFYF